MNTAKSIIKSIVNSIPKAGQIWEVKDNATGKQFVAYIFWVFLDHDQIQLKKHWTSEEKTTHKLSDLEFIEVQPRGAY
jgi:hypothetical protein